MILFKNNMNNIFEIINKKSFIINKINESILYDIYKQKIIYLFILKYMKIFV